MNIETVILDTPPVADRNPLMMAAKRYTYPGQTPRDGVTLLMFHGLGQHKEQWEPVIEKLYALHSERSLAPQIREVWSFDWQSHGESAALNAKALKDDTKSAPLDQWGSAIAGFIKSHFVKAHHLVGIGYSSGTIGLMLSTRHFEKCPYVGIILVEPSMMDKETWDANHDEIQPAFDMVTNAVMHRRNVWASKEAAHKYFMARFPWNGWDSRIVGLFSEHGLTDTKDKDGNACVVRQCPTIHEASAFQVNLEVTWDAAEQVSKLSGIVPVHVVFGERVDLMPQVIRDCVVDKTKGRKVDSITTIPEVGHTIVQELPDVVGLTISCLLDAILSPEILSRL
ncbi:Alpha/beta hydrolase fold-1 [Mycena sp. CBHHK59/15]|nr:Alpha/beta hydrolase fold-1 [Mycena sp. CBHHK59/15]